MLQCHVNISHSYWSDTSLIIGSSTYLIEIGNTSVSTYFSRRTCLLFKTVDFYLQTFLSFTQYLTLYILLPHNTSIDSTLSIDSMLPNIITNNSWYNICHCLMLFYSHVDTCLIKSKVIMKTPISTLVGSGLQEEMVNSLCTISGGS